VNISITERAMPNFLRRWGGKEEERRRLPLSVVSGASSAAVVVGDIFVDGPLLRLRVVSTIILLLLLADSYLLVQLEPLCRQPRRHTQVRFLKSLAF